MALDRKVPLTPVPIPETGPLTGAQSMMLCQGCVRCCTYVAVEVDAPDTPWQYDQYVWLLHHKNVWMYIEKGNHWYVQFETVCNQLSPTGQCKIHGEHPVLCKKYDARNCERRGEVSDQIARFMTGPELVAWLATNRPKHHARYMKWFETEHGRGAAAVAEGAGAAGGGNGKRRATKKRAPKMTYYEMPPPAVSPFELGVAPANGAVKKRDSRDKQPV